MTGQAEPSHASADKVLDALQKVLASPGFERCGRLGDFLRYVVGEELAGRGDTIRGKTIAQDVYGRQPEEGSDSENVVRVDARRLRQQLDHYYDGLGATDDVRIIMDPGGYRPRFEAQSGAPPRARAGRVARAVSLAGSFVIGAVVGTGLVLAVTQWRPGSTPLASTAEAIAEARPGASKTAERMAIFEKSPASLEAISLADQAQRMIFPIFDLPRQELMTLVFEQVVNLDPDYFAGHAGLAQNLSIRAILTPDPDARPSFRSRASAAAETARRLAPAEPQTQIALAFVAFSSGDYDEAMRLAELAARLAPEDGRILDSLGAIALFSGHFDRAVEASNRGQAREGSNQRFANRNIYAAASYHLGNYRASYETFEEAAAFGDPLSAPSLAYEAAALAALGNEKAATRKLDELAKAWPDAALDRMLYGIHSDRAHADEVLERLRGLGWSAQNDG